MVVEVVEALATPVAVAGVMEAVDLPTLAIEEASLTGNQSGELASSTPAFEFHQPSLFLLTHIEGRMRGLAAG